MSRQLLATPLGTIGVAQVLPAAKVTPVGEELMSKPTGRFHPLIAVRVMGTVTV